MILRCFASFLALTLAACVGLAQTDTTPRKAPELTFFLPDAGQKTLSQYKGKVVALEFILTTCVHCQAASKVMTRLQSEYGSKGLQVIDVALNALGEGRDPKAAAAMVAKFKQDFQVGFPVGFVQHDEMAGFMGFSLMQRTVVPQLALIDRDGFIHYQTPPGGDEHSMQEGTIRERVEELLALRSTGSATKAKAATPVRKHT